jgi:hypothetical protein
MLINLRKTAMMSEDRKIVGLYIGWPGASMEFPGIEEMSFWARKSVAHEVGKGGVTEVLAALEEVQHSEIDPRVGGKDRMLAVIGHSFGGAIVVTALSEVMLARAENAKPSNDCEPDPLNPCSEPCALAQGFGDAVAILNPAIEANEVLPLKSVVSQHCYPPSQPKLLHVLSTDADTATNVYFPLGQTLAMITWDEEKALPYTFRDEKIDLDERQLDRTTVGNYPGYWTGRMFKQKKITSIPHRTNTAATRERIASHVQPKQCMKKWRKRLPFLPLHMNH